MQRRSWVEPRSTSGRRTADIGGRRGAAWRPASRRRRPQPRLARSSSGARPGRTGSPQTSSSDGQPIIAARGGAHQLISPAPTLCPATRSIQRDCAGETVRRRPMEHIDGLAPNPGALPAAVQESEIHVRTPLCFSRRPETRRAVGLHPRLCCASGVLDPRDHPTHGGRHIAPQHLRDIHCPTFRRPEMSSAGASRGD